MTQQVSWLNQAREQVREPAMVPVWDRELKSLFPAEEFSEVTVHNLFAGYSQKQRERVVLAVVVSGTGESGGVRPHSHMVKLGLRSQVEKDYTGWLETIVESEVVSRQLSPVRGVELPECEGQSRYATVYEDAFRFYGIGTGNDLPRSLEDAVQSALKGNDPAVESVERLLTELFCDLFRCCYRRSGDQPDAAADFYRKELSRPSKSHLAEQLSRKDDQSGPTVWELWNEHPKLTDLRRDALWLTSVKREPRDTSPPQYLDPVDWFRAVLMEPSRATDSPRIPETLVGPGHGDLHGLNVIVGVLRGEAFQPTVIDYGDMHPSNNLPVWDFVKLEMELKCRMLPELCDSEGARVALLKYINARQEAASDRDRPDGQPLHIPADLTESAVRVRRLETAFLFERALASHMALIDGRDSAAGRIRGKDRSPTGHAPVDRALSLLVSLRKEAAFLLGYSMGRVGSWQDEYLFAIAAYGLLTAKWDVDGPHQAWALISAGVALAAQEEVKTSPAGLVARLNRASDGQLAEGPDVSHFPALACGAALNRHRKTDKAIDVLTRAASQFPLAVAIRTELALALARSGRPDDAARQVDEFLPHCCLFGDYETVCRIGRIYKDLGDDTLRTDCPPHADFVNGALAGYQLYRMAFQHYEDAYRFSGHFYPGVNAATLALLTGQPERAREFAEEVLNACSLARVEPLQRMWIFATEGEASLLAGRDADALRFYQNAFDCDSCSATAAQSMAAQLQRIQWALAPERDPVSPILELIRSKELPT